MKTKIKKWLSDIWEYTESYLDTRIKQILFFGSVILSILVAAYIVAVFDVGLINLDMSISGMIHTYWTTEAAFPWGIFFVLVLCILFVAALVIWKNGYSTSGRNFKLSKSDVYGSGREISRRELQQVADVTDKDATTNHILGQFDATGKQVIARKLSGAMPNDNMLIFGPPGCGKSTSYVLPFIMQTILRRESIIVSDTKGEVYSKTIEAARRHGYRTLRLDLKDPAHSDGWHVLKELHNDDVRALIFAQTVMANSGSDRDAYAAPQESLLKACCLFQERHPDLPEEQRTFYGAFSLLLQGAETLDKVFTETFSNYGACMQIVNDAYSTFLRGSPNLRGNIITGLANRLQVLASPSVREMTSKDEINFADIGREPTILYISLSDQHQTMSFLASLAFSFAFLDLVELADDLPNQRLPIPVHFLMEEFGNIGRVPNIHNYLSTARSRGISINLVVQSLGQLLGIYEEDMTNTILADCATWMCLGCNDKATADLLEWRSGEATVNVQTVQHDAVEPAFKLAHRNSTGDGRRNFYTSNDIMKIKARKENLIIWQQLDSLKVLAFPIFMHREFIDKNMPEVSAKSLIPLSNTKAKKIFREWEEERIMAFREWQNNGGNPLKDYKGFPAKTPGPMNGEPIPDIIPVHVLENMAIAKAEGKEYDYKRDKHNPGKIPYHLLKQKEGEEILVDISNLAFDMVGEAEEAPTSTSDVTAPANQVQTDTITQPTAATDNPAASEPCEEETMPEEDFNTDTPIFTGAQATEAQASSQNDTKQDTQKRQPNNTPGEHDASGNKTHDQSQNDPGTKIYTNNVEQIEDMFLSCRRRNPAGKKPEEIRTTGLEKGNHQKLPPKADN